MPEFSGSGGALSPTDETDDSGKPQESFEPAGGGGVRTTNICSSGQMPSVMFVTRPAMPSTKSSLSIWNCLTAALVA